MLALIRTGCVVAVMGLPMSLPTSAEAQWFGWGGWGWDEPAWTSYYPGSYGGGYGSYSGGYGSYYAPGGCGCDPCACQPCGCDPCGCNPCGSACGAGGCSSGNCAGGNCAYDAPANGAPVPDPNSDAPPVKPRTTTPTRTPPRTTPRTTPKDDDAPPFEAPMTPMDERPPRTRSTDPADSLEPLPRRRTTDPADPGAGSVDPFDAANPDASGGAGTRRVIPDGSTAPAGGTARPRPATGNDGLIDPANDGSFGGARKPVVPEESGTVIPQRKPAETPEVKDGSDADTTGPRLDLKTTSAPVVPKTRLAAQSRKTTAAITNTAKKPVVRDWSAAMTEPRVIR